MHLQARTPRSKLGWLALAWALGIGCGGAAGPQLSARITSKTGYPEVDWTGTALDKADGFAIFRADESGDWTRIGQVGSRTRTWVDKLDAVPGWVYRYQVAALRGEQILAWSGDVPQASTALLPDTVISSAPDKPLGIINETDIGLDAVAGENPIAGYLWTFDYYPPTRQSDPTIPLRNLSQGDHQITVWAVDAAGNLDITPATATFTVSVAFAPKLIALGNSKHCTRERTVDVNISAKDAAEVRLSENADLSGAEWRAIPADGHMTFPLSDGEGRKTLFARFRSPAGESLTVSDICFYDVTPPQLLIEQPTPGVVTSHTTITVVGSFRDDSPLDPILVNKTYALKIGMDGFMRPLFPLVPGRNTIEVSARDCAGNEATVTADIVRDPNAPAGNCGT